MTRCPSCARQVSPDDRFCPGCGAPLTPPETVRTRAPDAEATLSVESPAAPDRAAAAHDTATSTPAGHLDQGRFLPGTVLAGRYRIIGPLGRGGMGEIYRADDLKLGQTVALKFLPPDLGHDPGRLRHLHNEVRAARQVSHPNVCRVYDIAEADGQHFISMEYIDGEDLARLLRRIGRLPPDKGVQIARQLCAGLAAAHDRELLHRDLKPSNVMIDGRGHARLTDFGLAHAVGDPNAPIATAGTPAYMAPEQLAGGEPTVRSDIYSLGLIIYELLTGDRPPRDDTGAVTHTATAPATATATGTTGATDTPASRLDPAVERAVLRCLEVDPAGRRPARRRARRRRDALAGAGRRVG